ncbi:MAG TPA: hypothetical protein VM537_12380 [Anaerolineae bacterium]|nr:hypothetical protein [Anaerolineae bacterium]
MAHGLAQLAQALVPAAQPALALAPVPLPEVAPSAALELGQCSALVQLSSPVSVLEVVQVEPE